MMRVPVVFILAAALSILAMAGWVYEGPRRLTRRFLRKDSHD